MPKRMIMFLEVALAVVAVLALAGCTEMASSLSQGLAPSSTESQTPDAQSSQVESSTDATTAAKPVNLVIEDEEPGKGHAAKPGDKVTVVYTGTLPDGTKFVSSSKKKPYSFRIGGEKVVRGLSRGVIGMTVGGKRRLTVQPKLAYGEKGGLDGAVPPNTVVVYEVELLKISK